MLLQLQKFQSLLDIDQYDRIIVDRFLSYIVVIFPHRHAQFIVLNTMGDCYNSKFNAPLDTFLHPAMRFFEIRKYIAWCRNYMADVASVAIRGRFDPWFITKRICHSQDTKITSNSLIGPHHSSFQYGLTDIAEWSTSFSALDYASDKTVKAINYLAMPLHVYRSVHIKDNLAISIIDRSGYSKQRTLYVNFGTTHYLYKDSVVMFVKLLMEAAKRLPDWLVVLGGVTSFFDSVNIRLVNNVKVFGDVDQISVLRRCSLFITHGGLNSIHESIFEGVPMIVVPISETWDRLGNAAKVEYFNLGYFFDKTLWNVDDLISLIYRVTDNASVYHSVKRKKAQMMKESELFSSKVRRLI